MGSAAAAAARPALAQQPPASEPEREDGTGSVPQGASGAIVRRAPAKAPEPAAPVVMPVLKHFEHAVYPPAAMAAGRQGDVVLALTIDVNGRVSDAQVAESAGNGFDEAAVAAAKKFVFEPARRGTQPVAVKILYRYSFTLSQQPAATQKPAPAPQVGVLAGVVRVAGAEQPLVGAEVVVTLAGVERRATSDAAGAWSIDGLPPGSYSVRVALPGFTPAEHSEVVVAGAATEVVYRLAPKSSGLEVTVQGERPPREVTRRTIERREIQRIPGTSGDALRSVQSLPGVARPPGLAGLLIVRGSAPQDTQTFVDGTDVPLIYHFGGLSSVIPTEYLERIDFYPGNFSARYGRVQGGIVDVGLAAPDTSCLGPYGKSSEETGCYHGMAQVDLIDTRLMFQGPTGIKGWDVAVGGRRSWIDTWLKPVLESAGSSVTTAPVYYDYQIILENRPTPQSRLSVRFYGSDDRLELLIADPAAQDPAFGGNLAFGTGFYRLQALYEGALSRNVKLRSMASVGEDHIEFSLGAFKFDLRGRPITTRSEFAWKLWEGATLNTGMDLLVAPFDVFVRAPPPPRPGEPDPGPFATRPLMETQAKSTAFRPGWYAELELTPTERLRIVPGARVDYARDSGHSDFSPRLSARYDIVAPAAQGGADKRALRTTAKGGIGLFHQPPQFQETDKVFGTLGLFSNRALHYSLGVEQELSKQIELGVEGFYKDLTEQVSRSPLGNAYGYNNEGLGTVIGLEALLKYKPDERFFGWIAYTLSKSVRQASPAAEEYPFEFDQTHNLIMLGSYRLGRGWEFGARFRIVSGPLATPVLQAPSLPAVFSADAGAYAPLQGKAFSQRLPLFHQLDVRVDKRWQFRSWRLSAYLDVQNAYNNAATEALVYNYDYSQQQFQTGLPIIPSLGMRGEF